MVDVTVKMISICGFEGMCARVAQWWSIALPRRGSRVRIPSRALKEIEKRVIRWMALFSMFEPCRVRTVRMSTLRSGRRSRTSPGRSATSRALKEIEKESSDGCLFFCIFKPCRVRTVRMSALHSGRRSRTSHSRLDEVTLDTSRAPMPL